MNKRGPWRWGIVIVLVVQRVNSLHVPLHERPLSLDRPALPRCHAWTNRNSFCARCTFQGLSCVSGPRKVSVATRAIRNENEVGSNADTADTRSAMELQFEEMTRAQKAKQEENQALRESIWAAKRIENAKLNEPSTEVRAENEAKYQEERNILVGDALFLAALGTCAAWVVGPTVSTPLSYAVGSLIGTAYLVLLGQYAASFNTDGGGAGQGRFALVFFLVLLAGKNREIIQVIPLLCGFFTYQLAALAQGLKAIAAVNGE